MYYLALFCTSHVMWRWHNNSTIAPIYNRYLFAIFFSSRKTSSSGPFSDILSDSYPLHYIVYYSMILWFRIIAKNNDVSMDKKMFWNELSMFSIIYFLLLLLFFYHINIYFIFKYFSPFLEYYLNSISCKYSFIYHTFRRQNG